jgi:hypothetical protein
MGLASGTIAGDLPGDDNSKAFVVGFERPIEITLLQQHTAKGS